MQTVLTTNNGYDTLLLVDSDDKVVSRWDVTPETLRNFLNDGARADDWHAGEWPSGFAPSEAESEEQSAELQTIAAYGVEYGRNGTVESEERREFWRMGGTLYNLGTEAGDGINGKAYHSREEMLEAVRGVYGPGCDFGITEGTITNGEDEQIVATFGR